MPEEVRTIIAVDLMYEDMKSADDFNNWKFLFIGSGIKYFIGME